MGAVVVLLGAVGVAVFLFWIPDIYSKSLQFGLACVFCFIAVTCLGILLEKKPDLEISTEGMQASHWNVAVIPWEEIEDVFVRTDSNGDHLCLSLSRPAEYHARAGRIAKIASIATRRFNYQAFDNGFGRARTSLALPATDGSE